MPTPRNFDLDTSAILDGTPIDANDALIPFDNVETLFTDLVNGDEWHYQTNYGAAEEVTMSTDGALGVIDTDGRAYLKVDTEGNAASDDLDRIDGGDEGDVLYLRLENAARVVVFKHNTGNIWLSGLADFTLSDPNRVLKLFRIGALWTDLGGGAATRDFQLITSQYVSVAQASITLPVSGTIPGTFKELELTASLRGDSNASLYLQVDMIFNGDTGANYNRQWQTAIGSGFIHNTGAAQNSIRIPEIMTGFNALANRFGMAKVIIPQYARTDRHKIVSITGETMPNDTASAYTEVRGQSLWKNTAAITSITLTSPVGNFDVGSVVELWAKM